MIGGALQISDPSDFNGGKAISAKNPLPVTLVVPPGGASLLVSDAQNAAYSSWPVITPVGGIYKVPAGTRNLSANVTSAGDASLADALGNVKTVPLSMGFQTLPFLPVSFTTTATATFWADS